MFYLCVCINIGMSSLSLPLYVRVRVWRGILSELDNGLILSS